MGVFQIEINNSPPLFFIPRSTTLPEHIKYLDRKEVKLKSFTNSFVDALYFKSNSDLYKAKKELKELMIICYESDVIAEERYLMERFIYGPISFEVIPENKNSTNHFLNPQIKSSDYKPDFKILSLDIETGKDGTVYSIGLHITGQNIDHKKVLMRSDDEDYTVEYIDFIRDEKELLRAFLKQITEIDPDIIIGWHVIGFDLLFLERRFHHYNIPFSIGRYNTAPIIKQTANKAWICDMTGRIVIDGPPTLRGSFYSFESYKLESVAKEILGTGKDITGSGKVEEIERRFREDKKALAHYNLLDCTLVTDIFNKLDLIKLTYTRAITCGLTMDRVGLSVASFDYFMLPMLHRKGLVAPDVEDIHSSGESSGGLVFIEEPGFYNSVAVLDFKSLYPSIIRTFFIDPVSRLLADENAIETPVGIRFSKKNSVLPEFIRTLMDKREDAKKSGDIHLSQSIKILMNSFYGVMGTPGSRFYHQDLPKAITGTGQWLLKTTKKYIEDLGYPVLYGDTDSLFVQLEDCTNPEETGRGITEKANRYLAEYLLEEFCVKSELELEFEKYFSRFFLPGLRGSNEGAKKRYAGLLSTPEGEQLTFTGLEFVRSDWTILAKEFQYNLFVRIFHDQSVDQYINTIVKELKSGKLDNQLVYKKRLTKKASLYTKNIPPQVKAALKLDPTGSISGKVKYIITVDGPFPVELNPQNIDYDHYIDKQLKPIADSILPFIGKDFESLVFKKQPELF